MKALRIIKKILMLLAIAALAAAGAWVLVSSGDYLTFLPRQDVTAEIVEQHIQGERTDLPEGSFETPQNITLSEDEYNELVFSYANGIEYGKQEAKESASTTENVTQDKGRISQIQIELTKDNIPMYATSHSGKTDTSMVSHAFSTGGKSVYITDYAWNNAIQPYLSSLRSFVNNDENNSVVLTVKPLYSEDSDIYAEYIEISAFSIADVGQTCNFRIVVRNYTPNAAIQYGTTETTSSVDTAATTTEAATTASATTTESSDISFPSAD